MTLPHWEYGPRYLGNVVYPRMAAHVPPNAHVVEVGCRPEDRGVISRTVIPHATFTPVDRDPRRARQCRGRCDDALLTPIDADVILSTCVLHHTAEADVPRLLANLRAPLLMFSGPAAGTHEPYGDHEWHLDEGRLEGWLSELGYTMQCERVGLTEPFCELLVVAHR